MNTNKPDLRFAVQPAPLAPTGLIDWANAPDWARYATYRRSGEYWVYWYAEEPNPEGEWISGAHSRDVYGSFADEVIIEKRPEPTLTVVEEAEPACLNCGQFHGHQRQDYPLGAKVKLLQELGSVRYDRLYPGETGTVLGHCDDGRAEIGFGHEVHTFHYPASIIEIVTVPAREPEAVTIPPFPQGVRLEIDVVAFGEYRIGYKYANIHYIPSDAQPLPFAEAMTRCWTAFCASFSE